MISSREQFFLALQSNNESFVSDYLAAHPREINVQHELSYPHGTYLFTPIQLAAACGYPGMVLLLLSQKANVNELNYPNNKPAKKCGYDSVISLAIRYCNYEKFTAQPTSQQVFLQGSARTRAVEIVKSLMKANVNVNTDEKVTPLQWSVKLDLFAVTELLIHAEAYSESIKKALDDNIVIICHKMIETSSPTKNISSEHQLKYLETLCLLLSGVDEANKAGYIHRIKMNFIQILHAHRKPEKRDSLFDMIKQELVTVLGEYKHLHQEPPPLLPEKHSWYSLFPPKLPPSNDLIKTPTTLIAKIEQVTSIDVLLDTLEDYKQYHQTKITRVDLPEPLLDELLTRLTSRTFRVINNYCGIDYPIFMPPKTNDVYHAENWGYSLLQLIFIHHIEQIADSQRLLLIDSAHDDIEFMMGTEPEQAASETREANIKFSLM